MFVLNAPPGVNNFEASSGTNYVITPSGTITVPLADLRDALVAGFSMSASASGRIVTTTSDAFSVNDTLLEVSQSAGPCSITGPANPVAWAKEWTLKDGGFNADSYPITLTPPYPIDGLPSYTLSQKGQAITFYFNGSQFRIVS